MILVNAENVYPIEVEYRLDAHPGVIESAVVPVDDPLTGQAVKAVVVVGDGGAPGEDEFESWCRETLAPYKVPTRWELRRDRLPRNPTGKVLKGMLVGGEGSRFVDASHSTPGMAVEESK